jgi:hypothetical protein
VWCNFPEDAALGLPGPKARPGLVFKVNYADDPPRDRFYVLVAYGTKRLKTHRRPNDFIIANSAMLDILRLPSATRFDLDNMLWLPWARPFFEPRRRDDRFATPTVSTLSADVQRFLGWTMARREALGLNSPYHVAQPAAPDDDDDPDDD